MRLLLLLAVLWACVVPAHALDGTTTGIDVQDGAVQLITTEVNDALWGDDSQATITWTFQVSTGIDTELIFGDDVVTVGATALEVSSAFDPRLAFIGENTDNNDQGVLITMTPVETLGGNENYDTTFEQQVGGTLRNFLFVDGTATTDVTTVTLGGAFMTNVAIASTTLAASCDALGEKLETDAVGILTCGVTTTGDITTVGDCTGPSCFTSGSPNRDLTFDNITSGTITLQAVTGPLGTVTVSLPAATDTLVGKATDDILTNKTLDVEATGNVVTLIENIWIPAASCNGTTSAPQWDREATGVPGLTCTAGTNEILPTADFNDAADECQQITLMLPSEWSSGDAIDVVIKWKGVAITGAVSWTVATQCVGDGDLDDLGFNAVSGVSDTAKGTTLQTNDAAIDNVTKTGTTTCAASDLMTLEWCRDGDGSTATDSFSGDALAIGVNIKWRATQ